jgi:uncharacterized protein YigE (DUF2233 family)
VNHEQEDNIIAEAAPEAADGTRQNERDAEQTVQGEDRPNAGVADGQSTMSNVQMGHRNSDQIGNNWSNMNNFNNPMMQQMQMAMQNGNWNQGYFPMGK